MLSILYYNKKENKCHHIPGDNKNGLFLQAKKKKKEGGGKYWEERFVEKFGRFNLISGISESLICIASGLVHPP